MNTAITIFSLVTTLFPILVWVAIFVFIIKAIKYPKNGKNRNGYSGYNGNINRTSQGQIRGTVRKYQGNDLDPNEIKRYMIEHGQSVNANGSTNVNQTENSKYQTINSHYSQETLKGVSLTDDNHNHAYEHKVEPIEEASVHDMFEDRKEAYREKKKQMMEDLPKSSYSEAEDRMEEKYGKNYREEQQIASGKFGRDGDNGAVPSYGEAIIKCRYCGANNIVPASRSNSLKCYFCRQQVADN